MIVVYLVVFIFSLMNAPMDDLIYYSNVRIPGWFADASSSSSSSSSGVPPAFETKLRRWHAFNLIRVWGCIIAWIILCFDTQPYNFNDSNWEALMAQRRRGQAGARTEARPAGQVTPASGVAASGQGVVTPLRAPLPGAGVRMRGPRGGTP